MKEDLLSHLPQEVIVEILIRLPSRSIAICNCVCKLVRSLIQGDVFAYLYAPGRGMVFGHEVGLCALYDEACQPLYRFSLPPPHIQYPTPDHVRIVIDSTDGLVLVWDELKNNHNILFICNPMTEGYIELPPLPATKCIFGFGVSKLSQQYKVLCVESKSLSCHIYTLGGGDLWRSIMQPPQAVPVTRLYSKRSQSPKLLDYALFFNGNLHWLVSDYKKNFLICCFDLETELFKSFSIPPSPSEEGFTTRFHGTYRIYILKGRLCLCDNTDDLVVVIWMMEDYGDTNSWLKEYEFSFQLSPNILFVVYPIKILANG